MKWIKMNGLCACNQMVMVVSKGCFLKFLLLLGLLSIGTLGVNGQTLQEWTKQKQLQTTYKINQIVALDAYLDVAKKGYDIVRTGWGLVGDIQHGEFSLHQDYFNALSSVNPWVSAYPAAERIVGFQRQILGEVNWSDSFLSDSEYLSLTEKGLCTRTNHNILQQTEFIVRQLEDLLTAYSYEMEDGERMEVMDELERQIAKLYSSLKGYNQRIRALEYYRTSGKRKLDQFNSLYDVQ